ncbi:phage portal protein [Nocardioides alkalitolerans]|uniref:phage portal protein n=1 Tax=Nocardioides alkalitolerans TaxID=281714 RepID=UPI0003FBAC58|nr:phage portal protein [Nocardioides alkalitolerans]
MAVKDKLKVARRAMAVLHDDLDRLEKIDRYEQGDQDLPFMPDLADAEYKLHAHRAITNVIPFITGTSAQMLFVDSFKRGHTSEEKPKNAAESIVLPEWDHWQKSGLDARQSAVYRGALKFGHSFVLTEKDAKRGVVSRGLSALRTVALYEDPANDDEPYVAFTVTRWPSDGDGESDKGKAVMWDDTFRYEVRFKSLGDSESVTVLEGKRHGASRTPVTRFAAAVDLEGRTCGVVEPMFMLQDRINQTVFDLLIVQTFASFKVRTVTGMAPPMKMKAIDANGNTIDDPASRLEDVDDWVPDLDANGKPIPDGVNLSAKRIMFAEDPDSRFGTLDETPLDGFISAIELGFRHMAALSQTPPHHILGEISNLSAEALSAAETSLLRKVGEFKSSFGESWERVFRVAAEIGEHEGADDFAGEVVWRDVSNISMSQTSDALLKLRDLGVPARGLWPRIPGTNANELAWWDEEKKSESPAVALAQTTSAASNRTRPSFRAGAQPSEAVGAATDAA